MDLNSGSQHVRPPDESISGPTQDTSDVVPFTTVSQATTLTSSELTTNTSDELRRNSNERNASSSRASTHSVSSNLTTSTASLNVPQLKRKHGKKHMRQHLHSAQVGPSTSISVTENSPVTTSTQPSTIQSSPSKSLVSHLARSNTAPSPKRPPASHSSYGVETIVGPPPSFDTRRTHSQERVWRADRSKSLRMTLGADRIEAQQQQQQQQQPSQSQAQTLTITNKTSVEPKQGTPATPQLAHSSPETADTQSIPTPIDADDIAVMDVRNEQGLGLNHSEVDSKTSSESHKSEDLFLNIARVDAGRPSSSKGDKRKSRISLPYLSGTRPATSHNLESTRPATNSSLHAPRPDFTSYHNKSSSLQLGQTQGFDQASEQGSTDASNSGNYSKRSSTLYADTIRASQRSNLSLRNSRLVSESGYVDRPKFGEQNATESTASTTAPSTVWDELDDLKSRIRKLELTGKLPSSSAAAMSSAERPRTATTAATTLSSSPKHNKMSNQMPSTVEGVSPGVHPLLHEALGNAKAVVSHDVYQKLQATAQDALQLVSLSNFDTNSVRSGVPASTERQIRRRTESMCRSLTELAIALAAESKASQPAYRPGSREYHASPSMIRSRRYSQTNEPTDRPPVSARIQSRLDSRRVSTQHGYPPSPHAATDTDSPSTLPPYPQQTTRSIRVSSTFRPRRVGGVLDGANDEDESSPAIRPISRAMTDVNALRRPSRDHAALSREYTSQHPMPSKTESPATTRTPLPANLSTNFTTRRKYYSPATNQQQTVESSPLTSRQSWGRISIVHQDNAPLSDTVSEAPGQNRSVSTRRSLGFASRLGSSVGNRLRAARTERIESRSYKESPVAESGGGVENGARASVT